MSLDHINLVNIDVTLIFALTYVVFILIASLGIQLMTQGMEEGYVLLINKKIVIYGPPCVDKTAFKDLLFNHPPLKHHHSTLIASRPVQAIERMSGNLIKDKKWDEVTEEYLFRTLCDAIHDINKPTTSHASSSKVSSILSQNSPAVLNSTRHSPSPNPPPSPTPTPPPSVNLLPLAELSTETTPLSSSSTVTTTRDADYCSKGILDYLVHLNLT